MGIAGRRKNRNRPKPLPNGGKTMSDKTNRNQQRVHISQRGTRYVKVSELLDRDSAKEKIKRMSDIVKRTQEKSGGSQ